MKRMLNDEIIKLLEEADLEELNKLLSRITISTDLIQFNGDVQFADDVAFAQGFGVGDGSIVLTNGLGMMEDEASNKLFPLSEANAGKVLAVNSAGTGVEAVSVSGGTQLYSHTFKIDSEAYGTNLIFTSLNGNAIDTSTSNGINTGLDMSNILKIELSGYISGIVIRKGYTGSAVQLTYIKSDNTFATINITPDLSADTVIPL